MTAPVFSTSCKPASYRFDESALGESYVWPSEVNVSGRFFSEFSYKLSDTQEKTATFFLLNNPVLILQNGKQMAPRYCIYCGKDRYLTVQWPYQKGSVFACNTHKICRLPLHIAHLFSVAVMEMSEGDVALGKRVPIVRTFQDDIDLTPQE